MINMKTLFKNPNIGKEIFLSLEAIEAGEPLTWGMADYFEETESETKVDSFYLTLAEEDFSLFYEGQTLIVLQDKLQLLYANLIVNKVERTPPQVHIPCSFVSWLKL